MTRFIKYHKNITYLLIFLMLLSVCILSLSGCDNSSNNRPPVTGYQEEEQYSVLLAFPPQNKTFEKDDPPPTFFWQKDEGFPKSYIIEIDYMHDGTYMSRTVEVGITYLMTEEDWNTIKDNAPVENDVQKINWRIRVNYITDPSREPYYTGWTYFWIKSE